MIGLVDYDLLHDSHCITPNLEIMKLSQYYKDRNHMVKFLTNARNLDLFDRVYIQKDNLAPPYPINSLARDNVTVGGLAYTNNNYIPLKPEIEESKPDFSIYKAFLRENRTKFIKTNYGVELLKPGTNFLRISKNNKIDLDIELKTDSLNVIYDLNISEKENFLEFLDLQKEKKVKKISFVKPFKIQNETLIKPILAKHSFMMHSRGYSDIEDMNFGTLAENLGKAPVNESFRWTFKFYSKDYPNFESKLIALRKAVLLFCFMYSTPKKPWVIEYITPIKSKSEYAFGLLLQIIGNYHNIKTKLEKTSFIQRYIKYLDKEYEREGIELLIKIKKEDPFLYSILGNLLHYNVDNYRRGKFNNEIRKLAY